MNKETLKKASAATFVAMALAYIYWPDAKEETNSTPSAERLLSTSDRFNHPGLGSWIYNPGYCDSLLSVRGLQSYTLNERNFRVGNQEFTANWSLTDNQELAFAAEALVNSCDKVEHAYKASQALTASLPIGVVSAIQVINSPYLVVQIGDSRPFLTKAYSRNMFSGYEMDYEYHDDYANDRNAHEWEWPDSEPYRQYSLRQFVEYYDDVEFYEQFEDANEIINHLDRLEMLYGD